MKTIDHRTHRAAFFRGGRKNLPPVRAPHVAAAREVDFSQLKLVQCLSKQAKGFLLLAKNINHHHRHGPTGKLHLFAQRLDWLWQKEDCETLLLEHFKVKTLDGYGLVRRDEAIRAAGACLRYARETQRAAAEHITDLVYFEPQDHLVLDSVTVRNLELIESLAGGSGRSLLQVIDETVTGMGARLLRAWLLRPCVKRGEVEARLAILKGKTSSD